MTDEQQSPEATGKRRGKKTNAERKPRQVGAWVAKTPDGAFTVWTSELQARRAACPSGRVVFTPYGVSVTRAGQADTADHVKGGVWMARNNGDESWAPFRNESSALGFAVPDSDVQFLQNGGRVGQ